MALCGPRDRSALCLDDFVAARQLGTRHALAALSPPHGQRPNETAAWVFPKRPSHTSTPQGRGASPAVLLRTAAGRLLRRSVGRVRALASIRWPGHDPHQVRRRRRCESDQVADQPFTLHPEAPHRGGGRDATASLCPGQEASGSPPAVPLRASANSPEFPPEHTAGWFPKAGGLRTTPDCGEPNVGTCESGASACQSSA